MGKSCLWKLTQEKLQGMLMRNSIFFAIIFAFALNCIGCMTLLNANFDADTVGAQPSTRPAGPPPDDLLSMSSDINKVAVIYSPILDSNALKIERVTDTDFSDGTVFEGHLSHGPHHKGIYRIQYSAYTEINNAWITLSILSETGQKALELSHQGGRYRLNSGSGSETLPNTFMLNKKHLVSIKLNMDKKVFTVSITPSTGQEIIERPFLSNSFSEFTLLRFRYSPTIVEAIPGNYIIDNLKVKKIFW
jgi:hypothetical protein